MHPETAWSCYFIYWCLFFKNVVTRVTVRPEHRAYTHCTRQESGIRNSTLKHIVNSYVQKQASIFN